MSFTPEQLDAAIGAGINKYVNGKIDKLNNSVFELRKDFKIHVDVVQPIIEQFNDRRGFWNTLSATGKNIGTVVGIILGLGLIIGFLIK